MGPDVRLLRAVVTLEEERHFGRAAGRLNLSQPALSRQIAQLEQQVGAPLFHRTSRAVEPTAVGRRLAQRSADVLRAIEAALDEARRGGTEPAAVHIGIGETVPEAVLRGVADALGADAPRLVVHGGWGRELVAGLCRGGLDLVLGHALAVPETAEHEVVALEPLAAHLAAVHPFAREGASVALAELAGTTLLLPPREIAQGLRDHLLACCRVAGFEPTTATAQVVAPPASRALATPLNPGSFELFPESTPVRKGAVACRLTDAPLIPLMLAACRQPHGAAVTAVMDLLRRAAAPVRQGAAIR